MSIHIDLAALPRIEGRIVIIAGGASGIGFAIARLFSQRGARVVIADLQPPTDEVPNSLFIATDVSAWVSLINMFDTTVKLVGAPDVMVANAGITIPETTFSDEYADDGLLKEPQYKIVDINLIGVFNTVKLAIHHMRKRPEGGNIILMASKAGYSAPMGNPLYAATKHGILGMQRGLANLLPPLNIRLNCLAPGFTDTGIIPPETLDKLRGLGVFVQPASTVAVAALFLTTSDFYGKAIQVVNNQFREIESGYEAASEIMFGDSAGGRENIGPDAIKAIADMFVTRL